MGLELTTYGHLTHVGKHADPPTMNDLSPTLRVGYPLDSLDRLQNYTSQNKALCLTPRQRRRLVQKARAAGDAVVLRDLHQVPVRGAR